MNKLKTIIRILIIIILFISCDAADQYLGINENLLEEEEDGGGSGGGGSSFYSSISNAISDGVIAYWRMDELIGNNVLNSITTTNDTATVTTSIVSGKFNNCRRFNGLNTNITVTTLSTIAPNYNYTFSFWVNFSSNANGYIFDALTGRLALLINANSFRTNDGTERDTTYNPNENEWLHIAVTFNSTADFSDLYVNGIKVGNTVTYGTDRLIGGNRRIGSMNNNTVYLNGYLDDFAVWSRILSATEIQNIYNTQKPLVAQ